MFRYEILMLAVPEITGDETKQLEDRLEKTIEKYKGAVISFERWGKFRLAYPINKNDYGVYFLIRFETEHQPSELLEEVRALFTLKLNDIIMRHMVSKLDPNASLAYQRPQSLEDAPSRDVDSFLRENKMEGLLSIDGKRRSEDADDIEDDADEYSAEA